MILIGQITCWAYTQDLTIFPDSPTLGASETGKMKIRTVWTDPGQKWGPKFLAIKQKSMKQGNFKLPLCRQNIIK